jgi:hypothetical protein
MTLRRSIQAPPDAPFRVSLGPARFFLDDIRDVYNALLEFTKEYAEQEGSVPSPGTVEIRALTAVADEIDDLKEATRAELGHITLVLSVPKIRIDLWEHSAAIMAESENPMATSFARSIRDFVASRRSRMSPFRTRRMGAVMPLWVFAIAAYILPFTPKSWGIATGQGPNAPALTLWLVVTIVAFTMTVLYYFRFSATIRVIPVWRKDQRGLSAQTRTALIVGITCAIVAGVVSFWAGIFVHN